jgi:uncharacterized damage-inducible protein DinB
MTGSEWTWNGARTLCLLHERELGAFFETWRRAEARDFELPPADDATYATREALLAHVLGAAASYLLWICEQLHWPQPTLERWPEAEGFAARAEEYLAATLAAWDRSLRPLSEAQADGPPFLSGWGTPYCIDSMLEHAVMHPLRHRFQLEGWLGQG